MIGTADFEAQVDVRKTKRLLSLSSAIAADASIDNLFTIVLDQLHEIMGAEQAFLFLIDGDRLYTRAKDAKTKQIDLSVSKSIIGDSVTQRKAITLDCLKTVSPSSSKTRCRWQFYPANTTPSLTPMTPCSRVRDPLITSSTSLQTLLCTPLRAHHASAQPRIRSWA